MFSGSHQIGMTFKSGFFVTSGYSRLYCTTKKSSLLNTNKCIHCIWLSFLSITSHIHFEDVKWSSAINCSKICEAGWMGLCFALKSSSLFSIQTSAFSWSKGRNFPFASCSVSVWLHRNIFTLWPRRTTRGSGTLAVPSPALKSCWNLCFRACAR